MQCNVIQSIIRMDKKLFYGGFLSHILFFMLVTQEHILQHQEEQEDTCKEYKHCKPLLFSIPTPKHSMLLTFLTKILVQNTVHLILFWMILDRVVHACWSVATTTWVTSDDFFPEWEICTNESMMGGRYVLLFGRVLQESCIKFAKNIVVFF